MRFKDLSDYGQLDEGDLILINCERNGVFPVTVKEVLMKGTPEEEIIINKSKNIYFITAKYFDNTSWVKVCAKVTDGKIYSISNNTRKFITF